MATMTPEDADRLILSLKTLSVDQLHVMRDQALTKREEATERVELVDLVLKIKASQADEVVTGPSSTAQQDIDAGLARLGISKRRKPRRTASRVKKGAK